MFRSSVATAVLLGFTFVTLGMAAVSEYRPAQKKTEVVIAEAVFEKAAAPEKKSEPKEPKQLAEKKTGQKPAAGTERAPAPVEKSFSTIQPEDYLPWAEKKQTVSRPYHVRLHAGGLLKGHLTQFHTTQEIRPATITFLKAGTIFSTTRSGPEGNFQASGLIPGVYSVLVRSEQVFASFSIEVFPAAARGALESSLELDIATVPAEHVPLIMSIFDSALKREVEPIPVEPAEEKIPDYAKITPKVLDTIGNAKSDLHTFATNLDGSFSGRLRRLHPISGRPFLLHPFTNRVYFIQGNSVAYSADVDPDGKFRVPEFNPGVYTMATAGEDGVGAIGIRVLAPADQFEVSLSSFLNGLQYVSLMQPGAGPVFDFALFGPENFPALNQLLSPAEFAQLMQGAAGAGAGGGGGGGSGGGGAAAGAGGAGAAALGLLGLLGLLASP